MWKALAHVGEVLPVSTRIAIVRGSGNTFSSGLDKAAFNTSGTSMSLGQLATLAPDDLHAEIESFQGGFTWWRDNTNVISIAAVDGAAVGAGFQLALACDLRIATPHAKFSMREPALGLVPDLTGTHPLVRLVGYSRALELCATTRWIEASEAHAWGLVNSVSDDLDDGLAAFVGHLLTIDEHALRETKALLQSAQVLPASDQRAKERAAQTRLLKSRFR
jgi:enoyl-CoA hydratase/carnithine racemase